MGFLDIFSAAAFAEAQEFDTAIDILNDSGMEKREQPSIAMANPLARTMEAITFAEAGEFDTAREILGAKGSRDEVEVQASPLEVLADQGA